MEDRKKEKEKNISIPRILTREDQEMFQNDSYESKFESNEDDRD